jgi:hypothetical protein
MAKKITNIQNIHFQNFILGGDFFFLENGAMKGNKDVFS